MIICPKCKKEFSIQDDNIEPVVKDGHTKGWQHTDCKKVGKTNG